MQKKPTVLLQIINEYKQTAFMNIQFIKRHRINRISASVNESGIFFFPLTGQRG